MRSWPLWGGLLAGVAVVLVFVLWPVDSQRGSEIRTDVSHLEVR
jgi:hypothetical protein